ncbi:hypothetical protein ACEPAI_7189 [Sanghuangporus weigelae]
MAPHVPSDSTLAPTRATFPSFQHDPSKRHSLSTTVSIRLPSSSSPSISHVVLAESSPHFGVGPLIVQPSSTRSVDTENSVTSDHRASSPRLAYLSILVIPIIGGIVIYLLIRRRKHQKPARHSTPPPLLLRSETARARADSDAPRMQQLPRDRIRAMNSVNRDNDMPSTPPAEYQIFSPRPNSPPADDFSRPSGNYFGSVSVQGTSEPSTPLTISATSVTNLTSCPPTPCTPGFTTPNISSPHSEDGTCEEENNEVSRFTWDFRCKGVMNRLSSVTIGSILENSEVLGISVTEGSQEDSNSVVVRCIARTEGTLSLEEASTTAEANISVDSDDSTFAKAFSSAIKLEAPKALTSSVSCYSTTSGLTVLDIKFDVTSFSTEVIAALSETPGCLIVEDCASSPTSSPKVHEEHTPTKESKKRPVLSKPNHRNLAPTSPSLKVNTSALDSAVHGYRDPASLGALGPASTSFVPLKFIQSICRAHSISRKIVLPGMNVRSLRKSSSLSALASMTVFNKKSLELCEAISRRTKVNRKLGTISVTEGVQLRSSFSMPLALELLCLSHLQNNRG